MQSASPAVIASVAVTVSAVKSAQLFITLIKSVSSLVLKKEVTTIVCVFLRKAPTKKHRQNHDGNEDEDVPTKLLKMDPHVSKTTPKEKSMFDMKVANSFMLVTFHLMQLTLRLSKK